MSIKSTPTIMTDDELQADIFRQVYPNREPLFPIIMLDVANTARPRAAQRLHLTTNASLAVFAFATLVAILAFFWPYGYETLQHPCPCAVHGYTGRRSLSAKHIPLSWQPVFGKAAHKVDKYWLNWLAVPPILPAKKFRDTEEFKAALPEADQDGYKQLLRYFIENTNTKTKPLDLKTTRKRTSESLQNATLAYKPIRQCIKNAAPKLLSNIESWEFPATDVFLATRAPPFASLFPNDVSLTCRFSLAQLASQPFAATVAMVGYLDDLTRGRSMRLLETSEYLSDMEDILNFLWKHMEQQYWTTQQNASVSVSEYFDRTASWPYLTAYNTLPNLHDLQLDRLQDVQKYYIALSFFDLALFEARRYVTNELARTGQLQNASATFLEQEEAKHAQLPRSWWTNFWRPVFNLAPLRQMHFLRFREAVLDQGATRNASSLTDGPAEGTFDTCHPVLLHVTDPPSQNLYPHAAGSTIECPSHTLETVPAALQCLALVHRPNVDCGPSAGAASPVPASKHTPTAPSPLHFLARASGAAASTTQPLSSRGSSATSQYGRTRVTMCLGLSSFIRCGLMQGRISASCGRRRGW